MRCNNCGWDNPPGNVKCSKCNAPLAGSMIAPSPNQGSQSSAGNAGTTGGAGNPLKGTLKERDAFGGNSSGGGINIQKGAIKCPHCGYLASSNMVTCPNCGGSLNASQNASNQNRNAVNAGTINSGLQVGGNNYFSLRPVAWDKETVQYQPMTYSGQSVSLNRANTDANNNSITSKVQAVITNINGEWYIEDKSAFQSTYVHVNGRVKLKDGDIIALGNRKFEFKG